MKISITERKSLSEWVGATDEGKSVRIFYEFGWLLVEVEDETTSIVVCNVPPCNWGHFEYMELALTGLGIGLQADLDDPWITANAAYAANVPRDDS